jgi:hypothetical protein
MNLLKTIYKYKYVRRTKKSFTMEVQVVSCPNPIVKDQPTRIPYFHLLVNGFHP